MKLTRQFLINEAGASPRYQLHVDGVRTGAHDFLGIEESLGAAPGATILDLMLRNGVQRTTAAAYLWGYLEEKKQRQEAGGELHLWEKPLECEE